MFKKKENVMRDKKRPTMRVGPHKKAVILLWIVLISSLSFAIYKNFTAIDKHTIHEKEVIELRLSDTNKIENFVKNFAKAYYTWNLSKESLERRTAAINRYLTEELQSLNVDTVRPDIPTSSAVKEVLIWDVQQSEDDFMVSYEVNQRIKEGAMVKKIQGNYTVGVHVDHEGNIVIVQNPTLAPAPEKSSYEPKQPESDGSVDAEIMEEITAFLETFFQLYPTATEKELGYYVKGDALKPIAGKGNNYIFSELINPVYVKVGKKIQVHTSVKYLDQKTKAAQVSQFAFLLEKGENWVII